MAPKSDPMTFDISTSKESNSIKKYLRFWVLTTGLIFFFGCHNYMQELIMSQPGFKFGVILGYLEVFGVTACSFVERQYSGDFSRKASWSSYILLCTCLIISSAASNLALNYINYPTKVVFRSCKLIPTMLIAAFYNKKVVHWFEYMFGTLISLGMVFFAAADFTVYPDFNILGIVLVSISVIADAFLPNFQEIVFEHGASRVEVTYYTNILCFIGMTISFTLSGDIQNAYNYTINNSYVCILMSIYTILAYIAINFHMSLVQEFGGIVTVLVGNTRKALTIVLSFILFPKPSSILYFIGGLSVFGSLIGNAYMKEKLYNQNKKSSIKSSNHNFAGV